MFVQILSSSDSVLVHVSKVISTLLDLVMRRGEARTFLISGDQTINGPA